MKVFSETPGIDQLLGQRNRRHAAVVVPDHISGHAHLPTAFTMASDSAGLPPSGFSHITIFPACAAATAISTMGVVGTCDIDQIDFRRGD